MLLVPLVLRAAPAEDPQPPADEDFDVVELIPDEPPAWTPNNLFAPITGFFLGGGPGYWYSKRVVEIETTPPGAVLDLFYVRRNFQKRYEQADAPVRVILPSRIEATDRGTEREGVRVWGALGVGATKMKIHKRAIRELFASNDKVLDAEQIYELGAETT